VGTIKLKNIKIFSYHGCLAEEGRIGSDYRIDLTVKGDLSHSAISDELRDTIDYVHLNKIVKEEMTIRTKLLETVTMPTSPPIGGFIFETATFTFCTNFNSLRIRSRIRSATVSSNLVRMVISSFTILLRCT
jgi:hypothetical protein